MTCCFKKRNKCIFYLYQEKGILRMQLIIHHKVDKPLILPLGYHHVAQSAIFKTLQIQPEYSEFLHDKGYMREKRNFKLFTFGLLHGKYEIRGKNIIFSEDVTFEIRSAEPYMLEVLKVGFERYGIVYQGQHYTDVEAKFENYTVDTEKLLIQMNSPVCVYSTEIETGKTFFFRPSDAEFSIRINESFQRKYAAYTGKTAETDIFLEQWKVHPKDKYVTQYKGFYITAWKGQYILRGKKEYLDFLYQTGIGSKNSQGFGMFEIKESGYCGI